MPVELRLTDSCSPSKTRTLLMTSTWCKGRSLRDHILEFGTLRLPMAVMYLQSLCRCASPRIYLHIQVRILQVSNGLGNEVSRWNSG